MNVLVVDGDPASRRATVRLLHGAKVDAVERAPHALATTRGRRYEAIVIGARPGVELVKQLRARRCSARLVLTVEHGQLGPLRQEAIEAGADAVVLRDEPDLGEIVRRIVASRRSTVVSSELPPDLQRSVQAAAAARRRESEAHAETALELARVAQSALAHGGRGGSMVRACARALGLHRTTLQSYAQITRWSVSELRVLLVERRNVLGEPISISHLALLAPLPRSRRLVWTERVFAQGMTAHELRKALQDERSENR